MVYYRVRERLFQWAAWSLALLPTPACLPPVFIVGCGRSGTTILGRCLGQHPAVTYLNEPRYLWELHFPQTDIWSTKAGHRVGRLVLDTADAAPMAARRCRRAFQYTTWVTRRPFIIEKLPENVFRVPFVRTVFPGARFIHIVRSGRDVARSIVAGRQALNWYGADEYKWRQLLQVAATIPGLTELAGPELSPYERGLLEWRLALEQARQHFAASADTECLHLSYERLLTAPREVLARAFVHMGLPTDDAILTACASLVRESETAQSRDTGAVTAREEQLCGPYVSVLAGCALSEHSGPLRFPNAPPCSDETRRALPKRIRA